MRKQEEEKKTKNARAPRGQVACYKGHAGAARLIAAAGGADDASSVEGARADARLRSDDGRTPAQAARDQGFAELAAEAELWADEAAKRDEQRARDRVIVGQ